MNAKTPLQRHNASRPDLVMFALFQPNRRSQKGLKPEAARHFQESSILVINSISSMASTNHAATPFLAKYKTKSNETTKGVLFFFKYSPYRSQPSKP